MESKVVFVRRWLINFTSRALRRLRFFPFTLLHVMLNAALKVVELRRCLMVVRVGEVTDEAASLPRRVMIWLDRIVTTPAEPRFDVCLRLPREVAAANLHEVFSILLTSPRVRSIGLYWDASSLADDLPLLQAKQGRNDPAVRAALYEDLGPLSFKQLREFFQANHAGIALPVAVTRDAQILLKRQAGKAYAVCLNVPEELRWLTDAVVAVCPNSQFFDLSPTLWTTKTTNCQSLFSHGFTLHERMALVKASDAYVGSFDELGCAALVSKRPTILLGGGTGGPLDRISHGDKALWFPDPVDQTMAAEMVLQFLSSQLEPTGE